MAQEANARLARMGTKKKRFFISRDDIELFLISLPTTIWYLMFCYLPMFGILIAFKNYKPIPGANFFISLLKSDWVGLNNFRFMFMTSDSLIMIRNTVLYNITFIILGLVVPVTLALLMSQMHSTRLAKITQTMIFMPFFLSWVVVSFFVLAFLNVDKGLVNNLRIALGMEAIDWYTTGDIWPGLIIGLNLWKGLGNSMVLYLATIAGIDAALFEASLIDGASKWQQVWYITLPQLRTVMVILMILALGKIFNSDFGLFYWATMHSGPITDYWQTIDTYVYTALMKLGNMSFASAASVFQSIVGFVLILTSNLIARKLDPESALF